MMLYKIIKVKFRSSEGDTDFFEIVVGVLQGDTVITNLFFFYLPRRRASKVDRFNEGKWLYFNKVKKQTIPCIKLLQTSTTLMM